MQQREFKCPACDAVGQAKIWLIADTTELPGIIDRLRCGTVHQVACPSDKAHVTELDAPLLLYRPGADPAVLFLPAKRTSPQEDEAQAGALLRILKERLGPTWNEAWVDPLTTMSQEMARFFFSPEARGWQPMELDEVSKATLEFVNCTTWTGARGVLDRQPKLLTPLADVMLRQMAKDEPSAIGAQRIEAARAFLDACRVLGADRALADKLDGGGDRVGDLDAELIEALKAYMAPPTWEETREALRGRQDALLTRSATEMMQRSLKLFANDPDMTRFIREHLDLVTRSMQVGIDAAFAEVDGRKFAPADATARLVRMRQEKDDESPPHLTEQSLVSIAQERDRLDILAQRDPRYQALQQVIAHARALEPEQLAPAIEQFLPLVDRRRFPLMRAILVCLLAEQLSALAGNKGSGFDAAIDRANEIVNDGALRSMLPRLWGQAQNVIGEAYRQRGDGDIRANIEKAIAAYRHALEVITYDLDPKNWAQVQNNLGAAYYTRIEGSKADNLETAKDCYEKALRVRTMAGMPYEWAITQNNLGNAFLERIVGPKGENTEIAIRCFHQALQVLTLADHPGDFAMAQNNLGTAYRTRPFGPRGDNLDRARERFEAALGIWTRVAYPAKWAMASLNLANVHLNRATRGDRSSEDLAERHYRDAMEVYTQDQHPHAFGAILNSLGLLYNEKAKRVEVGALQRAISFFQQACDVVSRRSAPDIWASINVNLATAYTLAGDESSAESERKRCFREARNALVRALSVFRPGLSPHLHVRAALGLGDLHFKRRQWKAAHAAYRSIFAANELIYEWGAVPADRENQLAQVARIIANDAYAMAKLGRLAEAVEETERRLARRIAEVLERRGAPLEGASAGDRAEFETLREQVVGLEAEARNVGQTGSRNYGAIADEIRAASKKLTALLGRIRKTVPEVGAGLSFFELRDLAGQVGPLIYLVDTTYGGLGLLVRGEAGASTEVEAVWLDGLRSHGLEQATVEGARPTVVSYFTGIMTDRSDLLQKALSELWPALRDDLMAPLTEALSHQGARRATLISVGLLSFLPLHAATEDLVLTCAPSARVVQEARKSLAERSVFGQRLLAIGDPVGDADPLPFARLETERLSALFDTDAAEVLLASEASLKNVTEAAAKATYLHFAGHSYFDVRNPLESAMVLAHGDRLRLKEVLEGWIDISHVKLFVLSSCQTALHDLRVPNEAVGFSGALLQAGVPAVISTFWPVPDISTSLLMTRFYWHHMNERIDPANALRLAQAWVCASTATELGLEDLYRRQYESSGETEQQAFRLMRYFAVNPGQRPFAHPFFWAGFAFYGVGFAD